MEKEYLGFDGLSLFFNKLLEKFAPMKHTHGKDEIADLQNLAVADDDNGNVTMTFE